MHLQSKRQSDHLCSSGRLWAKEAQIKCKGTKIRWFKFKSLQYITLPFCKTLASFCLIRWSYRKKQMARVACLHCLNLGPTLRRCVGLKGPLVWVVLVWGEGGIIKGGESLAQSWPRVHTDLLMSEVFHSKPVKNCNELRCSKAFKFS